MLGRNNASGSSPGVDRPSRGALLSSCEGQSTLEYALVMFALIASITVMGGLVSFMQDGATFETVVETSAHVASVHDAIGSAQDLAVF